MLLIFFCANHGRFFFRCCWNNCSNLYWIINAVYWIATNDSRSLECTKLFGEREKKNAKGVIKLRNLIRCGWAIRMWNEWDFKMIKLWTIRFEIKIQIRKNYSASSWALFEFWIKTRFMIWINNFVLCQNKFRKKRMSSNNCTQSIPNWNSLIWQRINLNGNNFLFL